MTTYTDEVQTNKKYKGNVIIELAGVFFSIRQPDSGLVVPEGNNGSIISLTVNKTTVDLKKASSTIPSYSFRINDKNLVVSQLLKDNPKILIDEPVKIYLGRTGVGMDFADYFLLPEVKIQKINHSDLSYNFSARDSIDRLNVDIYSTETTLAASILNNTTVFALNDVSELPDSGFGFLGKEFVSWTGRDQILDQISGVTRGELGSTPTDHDLGTAFYLVNELEENPITLLIQLLVSTGTGLNGSFDVLPEGFGIDESLVDVAEMTSIRDDLFALEQFNFKLFNTGNGLKFVEKEINQATNTRLITNENNKISIAVLDDASFDEASNNPIGESTISKYPKWTVDKADIRNNIVIEYDWDDVAEKYQQRKTFTTELTEAETVLVDKPLTFRFKGIRESLQGSTIVQERGQRYLARFESPTPEITIRTHIDKSLLNVGDKVLLTSSQIPNASGSLSFADSLEIVSRAINHISGDVTFKLQYTSYSGIRGAYIAPCTAITAVVNQSTFEFGAGRAAEYEIGWVVRLFDFEANTYTGDGSRVIIGIDEANDLITVNQPWDTPLDPAKHAIRFALYHEVSDSQKRFAFVGEATGGDFNDGSGPYRIGL